MLHERKTALFTIVILAACGFGIYIGVDHDMHAITGMVTLPDDYIAVNVTVDPVGLGSHEARISWDTIENTRFIILYGTNNSYGYNSSNDLTARQGYKNHSWYLAGLAPNTTYHFCIISGDNAPPIDGQLGNATSCDGISHDYTFTTLPHNYSRSPQPPLSFVNTTMPQVTGNTYTVDAQCSDFRTQLALAQAADGSKTHQVLIPAGATCDGHYEFGAKATGDGWIIIRTATSDADLPGENQRVRPQDAPLLARFRSTSILPRIGDHTVLTTCTVGQYIWEDYNVASGAEDFHLFYCSANDTWTQVNYTTGTLAVKPSSCTPTGSPGGTWFMQTDAVSSYSNDAVKSNRGWLCMNDGGTYRYVNIELANGGGITSDPGIQILPTAKNYRFMGLEISALQTPTETMPVIRQALLVNVDPNSSNIIFDRTYLHGYEYPNRLQFGVYLDGTNTSVLNSHLDNFSMWKDPATFGTYVEEASFAINTQHGPGPVSIKNNFLSATGITVFFPEAYPDVADIEIRGNHFSKNPKHHYGSTSSDGNYYFNRHALEFKSGKRIVIEGNVFDYNFAVINLAYLLLVTPRSGWIEWNNSKGTHDISITNNVFMRAPGGIGITGFDFTPPYPQTLNSKRINISNNLFRDLGEYRASPAFYGNPIDGVSIGLGWNVQEISITHNTWYNNSGAYGNSTILFNADASTPSARLDFSNNAGVLGRGVISQLSNLGQWYGTTGLNNYWKEIPDPSWTAAGNAFAGPFASGNGIAENPIENTYIEAIDNFGFADPASHNFTITNESLRNTATDGSDPGADWELLLERYNLAVTGNRSDEEPVITASSDTSARSSGGGGGGGAAPVAPMALTDTSKLRVGEQRTFTIGKEKHKITLKKIIAKQATFLIQSTPITAEFNAGETKAFDLTDDGEDDIEFTLDELTATSATLSFAYVEKKPPAPPVVTALIEEVKTEAPEPITHEQVAAPVEEAPAIIEEVTEVNNSSWRLFLGIGIGIIAIIGVAIRNRKERKKGSDQVQVTQDTRETAPLKNLADYVAVVRARGYSDGTIRDALLKKGWTEEEVLIAMQK